MSSSRPSEHHVDNLSTRRAIVFLATALILGLVVPASLAEAGTSGNLAARAEVSASSTAPGTTAKALTDRKWSTSGRAEWSGGGKAVGSWAQLKWTRSTTVGEVRLVNSADPSRRVGSGVLRFSDGTVLVVSLSSATRKNVVAFTPRAVTWVRFTLTSLADGATSGALAEFGAYAASPTGPTDTSESGNVALQASMTASATDAVSTPQALVDGGDALPANLGQIWITSAPAAGSWVQADWTQPQAVSSFQIFGAPGKGQRVLSGRLDFSDGSTIPIGQVVRDVVQPTTIAFAPRSISWVRFTVSTGSGSGAWALTELRVYRVGATPWRPTNANFQTLPVQSGTSTASCASDSRAAVAATVTVLCPTANSTVDGSVQVAFLAPNEASVWSSVAVSVVSAEPLDPSAPPPAETEVPVDATAYGSTSIDVRNVPRGPITVLLRAHSDSTAGPTTYLQLYNGGDAAFTSPVTPSRSALSAGRTLAYDEEFTGPLSVSRDGTGADYAGAKPEYTGADDFGSAIFPDPKLGFDNMSVVDGRYLRLATQLNPPGYNDPTPWKRFRIGGMLASARWGGSGFSAQYGYFEAKMAAPAGRGDWPAFWMLPSDNLVAKTPAVAEVDAVELYGHDPVGTCHSTHQYTGGQDLSVTRCVRPHANVTTALSWHVYGVDVRPTEIIYYLDGKEIARLPQVLGGEKPLFFMVNLALGGGWPVLMDNVLSRTALYVDYVRVYV